MGKKIAFISALGGQGCTLAAAYTAKAAASQGHSVVLVDQGGFGGTLSHVLGAGEDVVMNINDAAGGECPLDETLTDGGENLKLLPAGCCSERCVSPCSVEVRRMVESLAREYDVWADIPAGTVPDCGMAGCFDMFVICSLADGLSLQYALALCRLIRKASAQTSRTCAIRLMLTRFSPDYMKLAGVADIDLCIDKVGARLLGVLPYDRLALEAVISGHPPDDKCELMRYAADAARRIYGARVPLDAKHLFTLRA